MKIKAEVVKFLKNPPGSVGKALLRKMLYGEYKAQSYSPNERSIEYGFVFNMITRLGPKSILDVGTGKSSLPHLMQICGLEVTAIDNIYDYWPKLGMFNRHYYVIDHDITKLSMQKKFDMVTCISTLEHIAQFDQAVKHMADQLSPLGHLILTCPYNEKRYVDNVYRLPGSCGRVDVGYICQAFSKGQFNSWERDFGLEVVEQHYWQCFTGEFWSQGSHVLPPRQVSTQDSHQLTCVLLRKKINMNNLKTVEVL